MIWIWVSAGFILLCVALCFSFIRIRIKFIRIKKDDDFVIDVKALFGLLRLRFNIPLIEFKGLSEGIDLETKRINRNQSGTTKEQKNKFTLEKAIKLYYKTKQIITHVSDPFGLIKKASKNVRCIKLRWESQVGMEDAANTGMLTGAVWGMKTNLLGHIFRYISLETRPQLAVNPMFNHRQLSTQFECIVKTRLGYAIIAGMLLIVRIIKAKEGVKTWKNILFRA